MSAESLSDSVSPRALITGLRGFTGQYLARELEAAGYRVFGTAYGVEAGGENVHTVDLCNRDALTKLIAAVQPDVVAHLAAISFVAHANVEAIYRVNVVGTRNLLEALTECGKTPRAVLLASSANVYGNAAVELIDERVPPVPANDYAVSKLAMEHMARLWFDRLPVFITRPFNYTGVGQGRSFVIPKIVAHYITREREIELGSLDVAREFSDVRMVASVYRRLIDASPAGEIFNVCSGMAYSLSEVLAMMSDIAGYGIAVKVNPALVRTNEVKRLVGSNAKLKKMIGDLPQIPLSETLRWMYSYNCRANAGPHPANTKFDSEHP
jgi:nucleoside-diphosphate-sugar epimerase